VQKIPKSFINGVKDATFDWEYRTAWDPRLALTFQTSRMRKCRKALLL